MNKILILFLLFIASYKDLIGQDIVMTKNKIGLGYWKYHDTNSLDLTYERNIKLKDYKVSIMYDFINQNGTNVKESFGLKSGILFYFTEKNLNSKFRLSLLTEIYTLFSKYNVYEQQNESLNYSLNENFVGVLVGPSISYRLLKHIELGFQIDFGPSLKRSNIRTCYNEKFKKQCEELDGKKEFVYRGFAVINLMYLF